MKTSDKIVLFSVAGVVGVFLLLELLHYEKYRKGEILDWAAIEKLDFVQHEETGVNWLVLDGPMHILFSPADQLKIDLSKYEESRFRYSRHRDTVHVSVVGLRARSAHDNWYSFNALPAVRVFFPALKGILIRDAFAAFNNEDGRKGINANLQLDSTQCYIGNYRPEKDDSNPIEPWDTITVRGYNCNLIVNKQAHIKGLDAQLKINSEFSDRFSIIDTANIHCDNNTALHLHGKNLNKLHIHNNCPSDEPPPAAQGITP